MAPSSIKIRRIDKGDAATKERREKGEARTSDRAACWPPRPPPDPWAAAARWRRKWAWRAPHSATSDEPDAIRPSPRPDLASAPGFRAQRTGPEAYDAIDAGEEGVAGLGSWRHRESLPKTQLESPRAPAEPKLLSAPWRRSRHGSGGGQTVDGLELGATGSKLTEESVAQSEQSGGHGAFGRWACWAFGGLLGVLVLGYTVTWKNR